VLAEKTLPHGAWIGRVSGLALIVWGGWMAVAVQA